MEIETTDFKAFAYTIKDNRGRTSDITEETYKPFFDTLKRYKIKCEYKVAEYDKKNRLHYHGIIYLRKGFYRKKICVKGLHVKLKEIYNKEGWEDYIHKDCEYMNMPTEPDTPIDWDSMEEWNDENHRPIIKKSLFKDI